MRKVSKETARAFLCKRPIKVGNSMVRTITDYETGEVDSLYYLHGNRIASTHKGKLHLSSSGWRTSTTKERLNALLETMGMAYIAIVQENFVWYVKDFMRGETYAFYDGIAFNLETKSVEPKFAL